MHLMQRCRPRCAPCHRVPYLDLNIVATGGSLPRTVLVTGGTSGIGRAIAQRFAADQEEVVITGRNSQAVAQTARDMGVAGVACDATDCGQVAALAARLGELDVLVNAAGGLPQTDRGAGSALDGLLPDVHA